MYRPYSDRQVGSRHATRLISQTNDKRRGRAACKQLFQESKRHLHGEQILHKREVHYLVPASATGSKAEG